MDSDLDEYQKTDGDTSKGIVFRKGTGGPYDCHAYPRTICVRRKSWIRRPANFRNVRYSDIVILTRSIKGFADVFTEVLNREGIPDLCGNQ